MSQTTRAFPNVHASSADLTETERHRLLVSTRRRHALDALAGRAEPVALRDLATAVVERERGGQTSDVDDVVTALHHVHLPKLADAGVLEYDIATNRIAP